METAGAGSDVTFRTSCDVTFRTSCHLETARAGADVHRGLILQQEASNTGRKPQQEPVAARKEGVGLL